VYVYVVGVCIVPCKLKKIEEDEQTRTSETIRPPQCFAFCSSELKPLNGWRGLIVKGKSPFFFLNFYESPFFLPEL
jgi:hypothetical protein